MFLEISTKVFMNCCHGGHQSVGKDEMIKGRKRYHHRIKWLIYQIMMSNFKLHHQITRISDFLWFMFQIDNCMEPHFNIRTVFPGTWNFIKDKTTVISYYLYNGNSYTVKSTLVQVMTWCCQATSHYLSQCWPRSFSPYGVTRPQRVKTCPRSECKALEFCTWSILISISLAIETVR